jgi:hypothetical protein
MQRKEKPVIEGWTGMERWAPGRGGEVQMLVWLAVEQGLSGLVRHERKRGKSVHYEVDPKELH